jgi:hypothetical protein
MRKTAVVVAGPHRADDRRTEEAKGETKTLRSKNKEPASQSSARGRGTAK